MLTDFSYRNRKTRTEQHGFIDLAWLTANIRANVAMLPRSYVEGKIVVRDMVMQRLTCSAIEAERIVHTMESYGLIAFQGPERGHAGQPRWCFAPQRLSMS